MEDGYQTISPFSFVTNGRKWKRKSFVTAGETWLVVQNSFEFEHTASLVPPLEDRIADGRSNLRYHQLLIFYPLEVVHAIPDVRFSEERIGGPNVNRMPVDP